MMAARAGARRVIGCEMSGPMVEMARRVITRNGYEETITVLPKQSSELEVGEELPAPASVLIAEILDVTLIGESKVRMSLDAHGHPMASDVEVVQH